MPSTHHRMRRELLLCAALMLSVSVACTNTTQPSSAPTMPATPAPAETHAAPTTAAVASPVVPAAASSDNLLSARSASG